LLQAQVTATPTPTPTITPTATPPYLECPWEQEPNHTYETTNGPLRSGTDYYGYHNDQEDYFSFNLPAPGQITLDHTSSKASGVQLRLADKPVGQGQELSRQGTSGELLDQLPPHGAR